MSTWATDITTALEFNQNVNDDGNGGFDWTNNDGVPFVNSVPPGNSVNPGSIYAAGTFTSSQSISANITAQIQTIDFFIYATGFTGTVFSCDDIGFNLTFGIDGLLYLNQPGMSAGGLNLLNNTWYRVQITFDGQFVSLYINGDLQVQQQNNNFCVGHHRIGNVLYSIFGYDNPFNGYIDQFKESTNNYQGAVINPVPIVPVIPPLVGSGQFVYEKTNIALSATAWSSQGGDVALLNDGLHTHFNVSTGAASYYYLNSGEMITLDFGTPQMIKKLTLFLYPQSKTYYGTVMSNSAITIDYWDGSAWQLLNWNDFNVWYGLPAVTSSAPGVYASTIGLLSLWSEAGITTQKIRITAGGLNVSFTEIEACDLVIAAPTNIRVNEISSAIGEYQGIRVDGTFIDTDYNIYKSTNYRANAFLYATYNGVSKYFGLLFVDSNQVDEQNYQTYIECVNIYDKLASANVDINADIGTQDYAQVFEWLLACADIYRDLYLISVNVKNYNYIPENTDVQTEINNVIQSGGDMQMLTQDGIFAIKSRISETPTTETINAYTDNWSPQFNLFAGDYFASNLPSFVDMFAPINGFSLAETFDNTLAAWGNRYLINRINAGFNPAPDLETNVGSTGTLNHYRLKLQTPILNNIGIWRVRGQVRNIFQNGTSYNFYPAQFILAKGQGTIIVTARFINPANNTQEYYDATTIDTTPARFRIIYYFCEIGYIGKIIFNQDTQTIVSRNDKFAQSSQFISDYASYPDGKVMDFQIESANSAGASVIIEAIGVCGMAQRSVVFTGLTPTAVSFLNLVVPSAASFVIFTLTPGDTDPVLSIAGSANSAPGDTMSVIFIPAVNTLFMSAFNYTPAGPGNLYTGFTANWTEIVLASDISIIYYPATIADIENGNIQVYPRDLKYLKGARNVDEDVVFNRLQIAINNFTNNGAANVYDNETAFIITNTASKFTFTLTGQTLDLGTGLNFYINVVINSVAYEYNYAPGTYYNTVMDCDIVFSTVTSGNTITAFTISITPRGQTLSRNIQRLIVSQAANVYDNELPFIVHGTPYTVTIPTDPLNLLKPVIMAVNVTISGVNYTFYFTPSLSPQYNATMDCNITFAAYSLGVILTIAPVSLFDRNIKFIKITAFDWTNSSSTTDIVNYADSQAAYGILDQNISNTKINSETQSVLIQQKYSRFLSLPVLFLADGATCDLIINIDLAKYATIQDQLIYLENIQFKIYEYEFTIDVTSNDYQMLIKGRAQSYSNY